MTIQPVDPVWASRMHAAAMDLEAHEQLRGAKIELRNQLVVAGIDAGYSTVDVASSAHVARSRVTQIVAQCG